VFGEVCLYVQHSYSYGSLFILNCELCGILEEVVMIIDIQVFYEEASVPKVIKK
jgi:hypothetical protein